MFTHYSFECDALTPVHRTASGAVAGGLVQSGHEAAHAQWARFRRVAFEKYQIHLII